MRQDQQFWHIVKDLRWKLDDRNNGGIPSGEPEFGYGGRRRIAVPLWATHIVSFLLGGIGFGLSLVAPALMPLAAVAGILGFVLLRTRLRRS
jgi:hypothetical protein